MIKVFGECTMPAQTYCISYVANTSPFRPSIKSQSLIIGLYGISGAVKTYLL